MRTLWMIPACILLMVGGAACQPERQTELVPEQIETQTVAPVLTPESAETQTIIPTLMVEVTEMISPDTSTQKMVNLAKEHLAERLGIAVEQITLSEVKPVVWRDASLGCPKPSIDYIQVETPGYSMVLETGGTTYYYHTDSANRFVLCDAP